MALKGIDRLVGDVAEVEDELLPQALKIRPDATTAAGIRRFIRYSIVLIKS